MRAVPVDKAGVGSAVLNAFRQVGGSIGIALMGAIMASQLTTPPTPSRSWTASSAHCSSRPAIAFVGAIIAAVLVRPARPRRTGPERRRARAEAA